jgi:hypothetical protein
VLVAHDDLELLPADAVGFRPVVVVFLHNLRAGSISQSLNPRPNPSSRPQRKSIGSNPTRRRERHLRFLDDPPGLAQDGGGDEDLLADHGVVLVVGVVGVAELPVGAELELEKLVAELALVPHVVAQVELALAGAVLASASRHCCLFRWRIDDDWGIGRRRKEQHNVESSPPWTCWAPFSIEKGLNPVDVTSRPVSTV